jgi:hypothetical protein
VKRWNFKGGGFRGHISVKSGFGRGVRRKWRGKEAVLTGLVLDMGCRCGKRSYPKRSESSETYEMNCSPLNFIDS